MSHKKIYHAQDLSLNHRLPWFMWQEWSDISFINYQADAEILTRLIPRFLSLDLYQGKAWVSIVNFKMKNIGLRGLPIFMSIKNKLEINLRTYVLFNGKPAVYFFSLDLNSSWIGKLANKLYALNYTYADISQNKQGDWQSFNLEKKVNSRSFNYQLSYRPYGNFYRTHANELKYWLTERYCFYAQNDSGIICRGDIFHPKWLLQDIEIKSFQNDFLLRNTWISDESPICFASPKTHVLVWPPTKINFTQN
jgi:uncharacterized protein YqjF (DUF2071 family)